MFHKITTKNCSKSYKNFFLECPSNCDSCFYSQGELKCSKSGCTALHGYKDSTTCEKCAVGCEECSVSGSSLVCDSSKCLNSYAEVAENICLSKLINKN